MFGCQSDHSVQIAVRWDSGSWKVNDCRAWPLVGVHSAEAVRSLRKDSPPIHPRYSPASQSFRHSSCSPAQLIARQQVADFVLPLFSACSPVCSPITSTICEICAICEPFSPRSVPSAHFKRTLGLLLFKPTCFRAFPFFVFS